jgi:hypothetical protein
MEIIISHLNEELAKKIIGNKENALKYLVKLNKIKPIPELASIKTSTPSKELYKIIVIHWDYEISKDIIRKIFRETQKYKRGIESIDAITKLQTEWKNLQLGPIEWPCSQGAFDNFVQRINSLSENGTIKDEKVKIAAVKYRRLKELNTVRNDYLETLIFNKNENIVPTLDHNKGVDFFINGRSFDQKVAKSPTNQFKKDFGDSWKDYAKLHPFKVAEYLYRYQDEGRFDADPRLYVVYLDEDIPVVDLKNKIDEIDISQPTEITFEYDHGKLGKKQYKTLCFVVLLSK